MRHQKTGIRDRQPEAAPTRTEGPSTLDPRPSTLRQLEADPVELARHLPSLSSEPVTDPTQALIDAALRWAPLDADRQRELATRFRTREVAAGEAVALPGDDRHEVLFVARGLLRFYYPGGDGREANKAFVAEGEFAGAVASAQLGVPILYGIEALEASTVLAMPYAEFSALMDAEPAFERLGRKLAETILARKERKARDLLLKNASERYDDLVAERPDLVQRVPLYHLASYLGITDVHLSRVRRQLAAESG